jgi:23S rRNA (guanosine2251-2'-O)-methyltransferase
MSSNKKKYVQVENKNAIYELLLAKTPFEVIYVASNAFRDEKTKKILKEAETQDIPVERITRKRIDSMSRSPSRESVIALKPAPNQIKLKELLADRELTRQGAFFLIIDNIKYAQNLGAIMRTAYGADVDAVIISKHKNRMLTEEVTRISMGASERIPIVHSNLFSAIKQLKDAAVKIVGVHMEGQKYHKSDLTGNIALVLGAEDTGISTKILQRCDKLISIPMQEGLGSLNVSASAAIVMYEKNRQDKTNQSEE